MLYKKVQKIEEPLSEIGIGCWNFGGDWDSMDDHQAKTIVCEAVNQGINLFDVAPVYGFYHAESVLGKIVKEEHFRDKIFIASKCGLRWGKDRVTRNDLSKKGILEEIDQSLMRLQTDHIDLYQLHWPDSQTPIEETVEALKEIKDSGKIRYIGLSNFSQQDVERFEELIEINAQQGLYNMLERNTNQYHNIPLEYKTEEEMLPHVLEHGQAFLPYSPLFQGLLTGTFKRSSNFSEKDIRNANPKFSMEPKNDIYFAAAEELEKYAQDIGHPLYEIAMNWLRQNEAVTSVIAGVKDRKELLLNMKCLDWSLTEEMKEKIDEIIEPLRSR